MKIKYQINDGYVGENWQYINIDDSEFKDMTADEKNEHIEYCIAQDIADMGFDWEEDNEKDHIRY